MTSSSCIALARSSIASGADASLVLRDTHDELLALGDDAAADGVAELALSVEAGATTQSEALTVLDGLA